MPTLINRNNASFIVEAGKVLFAKTAVGILGADGTAFKVSGSFMDAVGLPDMVPVARPDANLMKAVEAYRNMLSTKAESVLLARTFLDTNQDPMPGAEDKFLSPEELQTRKLIQANRETVEKYDHLLREPQSTTEAETPHKNTEVNDEHTFLVTVSDASGIFRKNALIFASIAGKVYDGGSRKVLGEGTAGSFAATLGVPYTRVGTTGITPSGLGYDMLIDVLIEFRKGIITDVVKETKASALEPKVAKPEMSDTTRDRIKALPRPSASAVASAEEVEEYINTIKDLLDGDSFLSDKAQITLKGDLKAWKGIQHRMRQEFGTAGTAKQIPAAVLARRAQKSQKSQEVRKGMVGRKG